MYEVVMSGNVLFESKEQVCAIDIAKAIGHALVRNTEFEDWYKASKDNGILRSNYYSYCKDAVVAAAVVDLKLDGKKLPSFKKWCKSRF